MARISKRKLIELTRDYLDLPKNENKIEFKQNPGSYELSFYKNVTEIMPNRSVEYHYTVTYTDFLGAQKLRIDAYETKDKSHVFYKEIDL